MKLLFALLYLAFSKFTVKTSSVIGGVLLSNEIHSQNFSTGTNPVDHSWTLWQTNTPTNLYGSRYDIVWLDIDSLNFRHRRIMFDSIYKRDDNVISTGKFMWINYPLREMKISSFDKLPLTSSQVTTALGFIPGSSTVSASQVTTALGYVPLQSEVDGSTSNEIQSLSLNSSSLQLSLSGGTVLTTSLPLSSAQVTNALTYIPLQSEVDGSITNEIQTLSGNSNTITLTSGGSYVYPITAGSGISVTGGSVIANTSPDQNVSISSANSELTVTASYPNFTLTPYTPTTFTASRAINGATFQVSTTRSALVVYTIRINCTATIGGAASGTVSLQYSVDGGSTWIDACQVENSNTVTLAIVLNSNTTQTGVLVSSIPANARVRMNQASAGTTTITFVRGQETY